LADFTEHTSSDRPVKLAIFDFDGTLADTMPFFLSVFNELAERFAFRTVTPEEIPALRHLAARDVMRHVELPLWKFPVVTRAFLARMKAQRSGIELFPGIADVLAQLAASDTVLAIVSSNNRENIVHVLGPRNAALISQYECGASIFGKAGRLKRVLQRAGVTAADAIYVGDQSTDHEAATAAGIPFGAVAWGYADMAALQKLAPSYQFHHPAELATLRLPIASVR